jgi:hypothetical protein
MEEQSNGSKLGGFAGIIIILAFFLPWIKACGVEVSGYDAATNSLGMHHGAGIYWVTLIGGMICVLMLFLVKTNNAEKLTTAAVSRILVGIVGIFPIIRLLFRTIKSHDLDALAIGGWLTLIGYIGVFTSSAIDLMAPEQDQYNSESSPHSSHLVNNKYSHNELTTLRGSSSNSNIQKLSHGNYIKILDKDGDAYCLGCHKVGNMRGMFYNKMEDQYYHEECIPKNPLIPS